MLDRPPAVSHRHHRQIRARQPPLRISWSKRPDTIINNGQLDFAEGDTLDLDGEKLQGLTTLHDHLLEITPVRILRHTTRKTVCSIHGLT